MGSFPGFRKQDVAGVNPVVDADDANDLDPAEFQEYCQFTTATQRRWKISE